MKKVILFLLLGSLLTSCASKKDIWYFQNIENAQLKNIDSISSSVKIQEGDILRIRISAMDPTAVIPFQFQSLSQNQTSGRNLDMLKLEGYVVNKKGTINYPELGKLHVAGKTTRALEKDLEQKLEKYIHGPTVSVRILNFKVTVLGEVRSPGTYPLTEEKITLPQILGAAGDLTITGKRHDVLIIRTLGEKRIVKHIDLTKTDWMNSPFYYLKQNDIIYVKPNSPKVTTAGFIGSLGTLLSVVSILLSLSVIVFFR